jgi:hypothetical protein
MKTTGPGSSNVKALLSGILLIAECSMGLDALRSRAAGVVG